MATWSRWRCGKRVHQWMSFQGGGETPSFRRRFQKINFVTTEAIVPEGNLIHLSTYVDLLHEAGSHFATNLAVA